jgi:hypothetical protein
MYTHLSDSDELKRRTRKGEKGLGEIAPIVARSVEGIAYAAWTDGVARLLHHLSRPHAE